MNLDHAQTKTQDVLDIRHDVGGVPRMQAAAGDQALGIVLRVIGNELVDLGGKANHLRCDIVDERGTVDAAAIQIFEKGLRRAAILGDLIEIGALALHQLKCNRFVQIDRRNVDVAVGDHCLASLNANG